MNEALATILATISASAVEGISMPDPRLTLDGQLSLESAGSPGSSGTTREDSHGT